jgi:hypothetical protein
MDEGFGVTVVVVEAGPKVIDVLLLVPNDIRLRVDNDATDDDAAVLLEFENDKSAKAYCGKIMIAESKKGIRNFFLIGSYPI